MSRRAAVATQADIHRAIRAMKQAGEERVEVELRPGGTVAIVAKKDGEKRVAQTDTLEPEREIVL